MFRDEQDQKIKFKNTIYMSLSNYVSMTLLLFI